MSSRAHSFVLALFLAACGGGSTDPNVNPDGGNPGTDGSTTTDGGPQPFTCSHTRVVPSYPWGVNTGTFLTQQRLTFGILADSTSTAGSRLTLEVWPQGGAEPTMPLSKTFSSSDRYKTCETCLLMGEGCNLQDNTCKTYFFAQDGRLTVTRAGRSEATGKLDASGNNITFVEWSMDADAPVPGGRCVEISSFEINTEWGDGGTCSGDPCGSGCCSDSPYCSLGNNNIGRFCSDFCGESGDGCTGPNDCCDGYSCFLGTCIIESCGNDTCSSGLDEGGGCCDQAAYCLDGRCAATCGTAGTGCGGDLDCCTGLSCTGGTCQ